MTRTLSENLYKAAKTAYIPETRMSKKAKSLPVLHYYRLYTQEGQIHIQAVDSSGETWELVTSETPARVDNEFDTCIPMRSFRDWLNVTAKYRSVLEFSFNPTLQLMIVTETPAAGNPEPLAPSRTTWNCIDAQEFPSQLPHKSQ